MSTEAEQIKTEDEKKIIREEGLRLCGYSIPWNILLIIALVVLYFAFKNGFLDDLNLNKSNTKEAVRIGTIASVGSPYDVKRVVNDFKFSKSGSW